MAKYAVLLRGINVGGKNKVPMAELKKCLEEIGFQNVATYIASGNVLLDSDKSAEWITTQIENLLPKMFKLDSELIKVLALSHKELQYIVEHKPKGFGEEPNKYYSDVIFLIGVEASEVMPVFSPRKGVDRVWPGKRVVYSERLGSERTKSRLSKIAMSPLYKSMTIRSWNTTEKLLQLLNIQRKLATTTRRTRKTKLESFNS